TSCSSSTTPGCCTATARKPRRASSPPSSPANQRRGQNKVPDTGIRYFVLTPFLKLGVEQALGEVLAFGRLQRERVGARERRVRVTLAVEAQAELGARRV